MSEEGHICDVKLGAQTALVRKATGPKTPEGKKRSSLNSLQHGLYAKSPGALKLRARRVRRLASKICHCLPWLSEVDMPAVRAWSEMEILGANIFLIIEKSGVVSGIDKDKDLRPRRLLGDLMKLRQLQLVYERELGMTPAARAGLRVDSLKGDGLASELQRARQEMK